MDDIDAQIVICVSDAPTCAEIESGRVSVGGSVARAMDGWMRINAVVQLDEHDFRARVLRVPLRTATFADAAAGFGVPGFRLRDGITPDMLLCMAGVTDSCAIILDARPDDDPGASMDGSITPSASVG